MAPRRHPLNYKVLYSPEENITRLRYLRGIEEGKNYHLVVGYTDLGAFLTPLSIMSIQQNIKTIQKTIGDKLFNPCSVRKGLSSESVNHVNINLKSFLDFDFSDGMEIVTG